MRPLRLFSLLVLSALTARVVLAQGAPDAAPPPVATASDVELTAELRDEYLVGEPILVRFTARNTAAEGRAFADLASRPWLVRFEIKDSAGKSQTWYSTPPETDSGKRWSIGARGQKRALLEIPSSARLAKGSYTLIIHVLDDGGERVLPAHAFRLAPAAPVAGQVHAEPMGAERVGHQVAWLHKAAQGFDLYLHHADGADPRKFLADYYLMHLPSAVEPVLSLARPQERWNRHIYWLSGPSAISSVRLQGQGQGLVSEKPALLELPYPAIELIGVGSTDPTGSIHVPFWVPAPSGQGGELRVATVNERGVPRFQQVARLAEKPAWLESAVDTNGDLRLLLPVDGNVDLYTVATASELPAAGRRIYRKSAESTPFAGHFAYLTTEGGGGLGALLLLRGEAGVQARWLGADGAESGAYPTMNLPADAAILDVLLIDETRYGLLTRESKGWSYREPGAEAVSLPAGRAGALVSNAKGEVFLRTLSEGGPVLTRPIR